MMLPCDSVAERVALGEPLAELAEHAASCDRCQRLLALPAQLGAARHAIDPGLGFTARMTLGAQQRLAARRQRRIATGVAGTLAAAAVAVFVVTRTPAQRAQVSVESERPLVDTPRPVEPPTDQPPVQLDDAELEALVRLSDTRRSRRLSADWGRIQKPLAPYMQLVKGVTP